MSKVFGHAAAPAPAPAVTAPTTTPTPAPVSSPEPAAPAPAPVVAPASEVKAEKAEAAPVVAKAAAAMDVGAILDAMAAKSEDKDLEWRKSIVDLLKIVGMDSSLSARKELAKDLGYTGDTKDSATMNVWLIKEVLKKFAENGGKLPAGLGH